MRHKLLSSGVTKGAAAAGSSRREIIDPLRAADPPGFWTGYALRMLGPTGKVVAESIVGDSAAGGVLRLATKLPVDVVPGQAYELSSGEEAPVVAIRYLLGLPLTAEIPHVVVRLGTTRGHERSDHASRRQDGVRHDARLRRYPVDRLSEPAKAFRTRDQKARAAVRRGC